MIHLLEVSPKISIKELKKLSRRYAMTGGYEVALDASLSAKDLFDLFEMHSPELQQYDRKSAKFRSNNSFRILKLIKEHPLVMPELSEKIDQFTS